MKLNPPFTRAFVISGTHFELFSHKYVMALTAILNMLCTHILYNSPHNGFLRQSSEAR